MKQLRSIPAVLFVCLMMSGCATIFSGPRQLVSIRTTPPGAHVFINDSLYGNTPLNIRMKRKIQHRLDLTLEGYEKYHIIMARSVNGWVFGNILIGGLIGVGIDALTGSLYGISPKMVQVELKPVSEQH